ncbi:unnamed protein product [Rangifer tarandus platyrhynchus]|uniref:Uncharacterized protein n=2 Tax=Rangifer tarandus platyrhynchus TaxID=3082113 RepID=A0AC59ZJI5_RANTA|nr:unnamed protein product [Rangifer tarandus platyrhynchus]
MSPTPNVGFYNTAVLYGLGLHWEWTLPHSFQTGIPWRVTFWVPSHWVREVHSCSHGLLPPLPVPSPVNAFVYLCVCVCVCARARVRAYALIFWSLKHLNKEFLP